MGFLDHSTNNIILDTVLTELGREFIARNDGSFSIVKFAISDDEVDYSIIQKYGRAVGKEKIEKNTPVLEALTNQNFAQKFKLVSVSNPNLIKLPAVTLTGEGLDTTSTVLSMGRTGSGRQRRVVIRQTMSDEVIDVELRDQAFIVKVPYSLIELAGRSPDNVDSDNVATYLLTRDPTTTATGGSQLTLDFRVKSIPDSLFTTRGIDAGKTKISDIISITGLQSGAFKEFEAQIGKTTA
jgi:hypothetical protein